MPCEPDLYFTVEDNRREVARMQKPNCGRSRRSGAIAPATRCSTRKTLPSSIERCSNRWRVETLSPPAQKSRGGGPHLHLRAGRPRGVPLPALIFFDIPEDEGIRPEHANNVLAPQKRLLELTERHIGDHLPETAVHGFDQRLLLFQLGFLDILLAQILFFFVARPTDEILAVAGHDRRWTDQRAGKLRAVCAGMKEVPAALVRRILLCAP